MVTFTFDGQGTSTLLVLIVILLLAGNITAIIVSAWALIIGRDVRDEARYAATLGEINDSRLDEVDRQLVAAFSGLATHGELLEQLGARWDDQG